MRDIKFRGKRLFDGEWAYGYLWKDDVVGDAFIKEGGSFRDHRVDPETVEQYVCKDANGNDVYEGDIVHYEYDSTYVETGEFAKHVVNRYRVMYYPLTFTFIIRPLIKGEGVDMNACYIGELRMVKEEEDERG